MSRRAATGPNGFTVIELVAVITITAVVATLAYSAFRTFTVRTQVTAGIQHAEFLKTAVVHAFQNRGDPPRSLADIGRGGKVTGHRYLTSLSIENGRVDVVYGNRADREIAGRRLSLTPYETLSSDVVWVCGNATPGPGLNPLGFAGGGVQAVALASTIEPRFLPPNCR